MSMSTTANTAVDDGLEEYPGDRRARGYPPHGTHGAVEEIEHHLPYLLNTRRFGSHICKRPLMNGG